MHARGIVFNNGAPAAYARAALMNGHPEIAKHLLMPVVASGRGTADEVGLLRVACDSLDDRTCVDFLKGL
jgi:hypothetical protein